MRLIEKSRGIGFRIAAITMLLVVISIVVPAVVIGSFVDKALERHASERIVEEMSRLLASGNATEADTVIADVRKQTETYSLREFAYRVVTKKGDHVAGDAWVNITRLGWEKASVRPAKGAGRETLLLILTAPLGQDMMVSVGRDVEWISIVEVKLRELMLGGLIGGIVLAAITAYFANRLIARRLDIISATAGAIMEGDLTRRMPLTGADDDFDRLSATLNAALGRIHELMQSLQQVSSDIAHDLRTPLGRLLQGLERARREATSTDEYANAVDRAISEAEGLLTTFTALLRIAQIEGGARRSALRHLALRDILESVVEAYTFSAEEGGRSLATRISSVGTIVGDRDLLVQMFANLIENALTHTLPGSEIVVALEEGAGRVKAFVADNGPGVPEAEREKIFQRFYRLEDSRTSPGTGLGLSLVAAVAKLHNAHIDVENTRPGLRITVNFARS